MWRTLGISKDEWLATPARVQTVLVSLRLENHSVNLRSQAHAQQISTLTKPAAHINKLKQQISGQQKQIRTLQKQLSEAKALSAEVIQLKASVADLKERLGQNSQNSSLPPSSDSLLHKFKRRVDEPSGRKQGAQTGHIGEGRWLLSESELDEIVEIRPDRCRFCGSKRFEPGDWLPARRQVTEITDSGTIITEFRRFALQCQKCRQRNRADWVDEATQGAFGPRVKAVIAYLTGRLSLSQRDTVEALRELFAVKISLGSISAVQKRISRALAAPVIVIQAFVAEQKVGYVDETGWREKNKQKWLWVKSTDRATIFRIRDGRGKTDAQAIIGQKIKGILTTDRYSAYNFIPAHHRQICWSHLKRDFQAISERGGDSQLIGTGLLDQTKAIFRWWQRVRDGTTSFSDFQVSLEPVKKRVNELLIKGLFSEHDKTRRTTENILKLEYSLWTFARVEGVEPTNNAAERALRRAVLWRKRSFGTQSEAGSQFAERVLTVIATLRQQRRSVLGYLSLICQESVTALTNSKLSLKKVELC